jgi:hypothetical protein
MGGTCKAGHITKLRLYAELLELGRNAALSTIKAREITLMQHHWRREHDVIAK